MKNKLQLFGWALFVICAVLFIISGIQNKDTIIVIGSIIFLIACFVFIADLLKK